VRVLLDTHAFLWHLWDSPERSEQCRRLIADPENELLLSHGSWWEMAIKQSLGKLGLSLPFDEFINAAMSQNRIAPLAIAASHLRLVATLPFHHRDPFDRLLISQSLAEGVPLLSRDERFDAYGVNRIW
jgi:PIN domain nuclease of toxin-antitoxin system